jgi:hypothetical protein
MAEQHELAFGDRWRDEQISMLWRRELRAVVEEEGVKRVAGDLDKGHSELGRALNEAERHYLKPSEIIAIMRRDRIGRALRVLASELGFEVTRRRELSPAEKLEKLTAEIERNPVLAKVLYESAFGPGGRP